MAHSNKASQLQDNGVTLNYSAAARLAHVKVTGSTRSAYQNLRVSVTQNPLLRAGLQKYWYNKKMVRLQLTSNYDTTYVYKKNTSLLVSF